MCVCSRGIDENETRRKQQQRILKCDHNRMDIGRENKSIISRQTLFLCAGLINR